jgi:hypothetical protein
MPSGRSDVSVGLAVTKADLDSRGGSISVDLRSVMDRIRVFKARLDTLTDNDLTALGYTATEVAQLRSAFVDMDKLRTIFEGTGTQGTAYDFRTFQKLLTGVI